MTDWKAEFRHYAQNLETAWPVNRHNQVAKLNGFLATAAEKSGLDRDAVIDQVIETAQQRAARRPLTIFLISCGSSGSHWLEAMLAEFPDYVACGEVYLPRPLFKGTFSWEAASRSAFMDCVHLAHVPEPKDSLVGSKLINSAHLSGWIMSRWMDAPKTNVLLLRNPVDIVISRTYRKDDYRKFRLPDASDDEYLERNIEFVNTFYDKASGSPADHVVKYEDLRQQGTATLDALLRGLGDVQDPAVVAGVVERHSAEAQASGRADAGGQRASNYYRGPRVELPDGLQQRIRAGLSGSVAGFGY